MDLLLNCVDKDIKCFSLEGKMIQAKITNVYDADTCRAVFYLDNKLVKYTVRLKGIDTPEIRPKKSVEFRDEEIKAAKKSRNRFIQLWIKIIKNVNYNRLLIKIKNLLY
jgi:endonuclease YncB( thermonuclease family)